MRAGHIEALGRLPRSGRETIAAGSSTRKLDRLNATRLADQLTAVTKQFPPELFNNAGIVLTINPAGQVVEVRDYVRVTTLPPAGYWLLGGHGVSRKWLVDNAPLGTRLFVSP